LVGDKAGEAQAASLSKKNRSEITKKAANTPLAPAIGPKSKAVHNYD
jgi:hypothetical protein